METAGKGETASMLPKLYTVAEAAEQMGMSETMLKGLIKRGQIGRIRRNSWVRLTERHMAEWLAKQDGRDRPTGDIWAIEGGKE